MTFADRYAPATRSSNLGSKPDTTSSHSDVLGAAGLAAKRVPLGMSLMRLLLAGDNHESRAIVEMLSDMAWDRARRDGVKLRRTQAEDMAQTVLDWCRDGRCRRCGGHGFKLIPGAPALSEHPCPSCQGGKVRFDRLFAMERLGVAWWLRDQVERDMAMAGPEAMKALAESMP